MKSFLIILAFILIGVGSATGQTEAQVKQYFEGQQVILKIDMPATKDGVNIYPERAQPLNFSEYAARLKRSGTAIRSGERIMVTKIKVKDNHIEFQLGGGGYGTIGDETSSSVSVPSAGKSKREKRLEEELKLENDPRRRRELKEELDDLRCKRERDDRRNRSLGAEAEELKRRRIEEKALQGGSRFNIHYEQSVHHSALTSEAVKKALARYIDFSDFGAGYSPYVNNYLKTEGPTIFLKKGLSKQEVLSFLGKAEEVLQKREGSLRVSTYRFARSKDRVIEAEFVDDLLIRYRAIPSKASCSDTPLHLSTSASEQTVVATN